VTRNFVQPLPGLPDPSEQRQKIAATEFTISTTMPGVIGLESLEDFAKDVIAAIEFLREADGHCKNRSAVISSLESAKTPLQLAIDEAWLGVKKTRRYQNISLVGTMLKDALKNW